MTIEEWNEWATNLKREIECADSAGDIATRTRLQKKFDAGILKMKRQVEQEQDRVDTMERFHNAAILAADEADIRFGIGEQVLNGKSVEVVTLRIPGKKDVGITEARDVLVNGRLTGERLTVEQMSDSLSLANFIVAAGCE